MNKIYEIQIYAFQSNYNYPICASVVVQKYFYVLKSCDSISEQQSFVAIITSTLSTFKSFSHVTFKYIQVIFCLFESKELWKVLPWKKLPVILSK